MSRARSALLGLCALLALAAQGETSPHSPGVAPRAAIEEAPERADRQQEVAGRGERRSRSDRPAIPRALLGSGRRKGPETLSWVEPTLPTTMHPHYAASLVDRRAHALVYDRLFRPDPLSNRWISRVVAEEIVRDGVIELRLRDGIRWHDGARFTGRDVCHTVQALRDPRSTAPLARRLRPSLQGCTTQPADPLRVEIALPEQGATDPRAWLDFPLIPAHLPESSLATTPIGTGPLRAAFDGRAWRFSAFDNPHHQPKIRAMRLEALSHPAARVAALLAGGVGGLPEVPVAALPEVRASENVGLHFYPRGEWWSVVVDTRAAPLSDPRVREALDLLLDREALVAELIGVDPDRAPPVTRISGPLPDRWANRGVPLPSPDPSRAEALLLEAGLAQVEGRWTLDDAPVTLRIGAPEALPLPADQVLAAFERQWSAFQVETTVLPTARFQQEALAGELEGLDLLIVAWDLGPDGVSAPFHSRGPGTGTWNVFHHADPALDGLLDRVGRAEGMDRRAAWHELHAHLADTRPHLFLWRLDAWSAWRRDLQHVVVSPEDHFGDLDGWSLTR